MYYIMKIRFQEEDAGLINCIAENKMGKVEKNLIVTILREMNHCITGQSHRFNFRAAQNEQHIHFEGGDERGTTHDGMPY